MPPKWTSNNVKCNICGILVRARGLVPHAKKCRKLAREKEEDDEVKVIIKEATAKKQHKAHNWSKRRAASSTVDPIKIWSTQRHNHENEAAEDNIDMQGSTPRSHQSLISDFNMALPGLQSHYDDANPADQEPLPQLDDIKPDSIHHSSFRCFPRTRPTEASVPWNHAPWEPFQTWLNFEVAEIALEAALTAEQTNHLLSLIHRSARRDETFTLQNHDEVQELWSTASQCFTPFQVDVVSVLYQNKVHEFDMHYHPLWEWALDMLRDRCLVSHFIFDAQRLYKFNGCTEQVPEDPEHAGKSSFVDFKNAVWHESFLKLLESVIQISRTGYLFECGDAIQRLLWPLILILSADYEEQCVMALICGLKSKFPCPICLVPQDEQSVLSHELRLQTSAESEEALQLARAKTSKKEREKLLKTYSLRDVEVWFARHHLWRELQFWILELGREAVVQMDANYDAFPRWSNLTLFLKVVVVNFNDTSHHEDILKPVTGKDWNFPKKHASSHLFDDILAKGTTQNYNTKPNEKMHGPVRDIYRNQTNFKDIATQILRYDHWLLTSTSMRSELDELDKYNWKANLPTTEDADTENPAISVAPAPCTHIKLGLAQDDKRIHLQADNKITGYKYLQVNYESMVNWRQCKDLL
ncbi:uncharacterized protein F5147DRAFT_764362 [Suillus discolor]|uniref:Uncharacterized protein n=1 Tax=Suillus discolor TaxID=1912936 RepID=A0A9P7EVP4_9AGAM|nr:uncharacterized protein F5147DRAFT_764362 [Suillus discolor]KAG2090891.1 hypothetical protein F5147DRAFT_764362 [Suillus discolor]